MHHTNLAPNSAIGPMQGKKQRIVIAFGYWLESVYVQYMHALFIHDHWITVTHHGSILPTDSRLTLWPRRSLKINNDKKYDICLGLSMAQQIQQK